MYQEFKARAGSRQEAYKSIIAQVRAYLVRTQRANRDWDIHTTEWKETELFGGGEMKAKVWIKDAKMKTNIMRFIDSCVGNIARKIEDEFDESKHPRDKGGKFTSKGGEGRGGGEGSDQKLINTYKAGKITPERADALNEAAVALEEAGVPKQKILKMSNEGDLEGMQKLLESKGSSERRSKSVKASAALKDTMDDDLRQISENVDNKKEFLENAKSYLEDYLLGDLADGDYAKENFEMSSEDVEAYVKDYIESGKLDKLAAAYYEEDEDEDDEDYMSDDDEVDADEQAFEQDSDLALLLVKRHPEYKKDFTLFKQQFLNKGGRSAYAREVWELAKDQPSPKESSAAAADKDIKAVRSAIDEELFELATTSESEDEFKSKVKRRFKQYERLLNDKNLNELPVGGDRAKYALNKIMSEIESGTSEYW